MNRDNERFTAHRFCQRSHLFRYLHIARIDATIHRAELALKVPIANRKVWGGNRTDDGAAAQVILASVFNTLALVTLVS